MYDEQIAMQSSHRGVCHNYKTELSNLAHQEHFRDIYKSTKDYLVKMLSRHEWKSSGLGFKLPKIREKYYDDDVNKRREEEWRRVKSVYPEELKERVKKIEFGIRVTHGFS
jgi:hypothetical protein